MSLFGGKEMERTCKRDGTVWYCSIGESKMRKPGSWEMTSAKISAAGDRVSPFSSGKGEMQLMGLENKVARVNQINACPTCGSSKYKQKVVRK